MEKREVRALETEQAAIQRLNQQTVTIMSQGLAELLATAIYVPPIVVISTLIGAITKSDKWIEVSPQRLNLSLAPLPA